jgi:hypothetical protein
MTLPPSSQPSSSESCWEILPSRHVIPLYNLFNSTAKALFPVSFLSLSNNAEFALESSVVFDDKVKLDESEDWAYEDVEEALMYSPDDFGVGGGRPAAGGRARTETENRTGSSLR